MLNSIRAWAICLIALHAVGNISPWDSNSFLAEMLSFMSVLMSSPARCSSMVLLVARMGLLAVVLRPGRVTAEVVLEVALLLSGVKAILFMFLLFYDGCFRLLGVC
jgi:hypothetical protein